MSPGSARDHGDVLVRVVARLLPAPSLVVAAALIAIRPMTARHGGGTRL